MIKQNLIDYLQREQVQGAFVLKDLQSKETICFREDLKVPSASLIKLFILVCAFERVRDKKISLTDTVAVRAEDITAFSVLEFLCPRAYRMEELLKLMIVYSDNTATNVLVDFFGLDAIDRTIRGLGYETSVLQRKMMDVQAQKEGRQNYTSAAEMADLLERLYENRLLGAPYDGQMLEIMKGQADETMMRQELPDEIPIARKSGELDRLDHDVAIVFTEKGDYIYVFFAWEARDNNQAREILSVTSKMVFDDFIHKF